MRSWFGGSGADGAGRVWSMTSTAVEGGGDGEGEKPEKEEASLRRSSVSWWVVGLGEGAAVESGSGANFFSKARAKATRVDSASEVSEAHEDGEDEGARGLVFVALVVEGLGRLRLPKVADMAVVVYTKWRWSFGICVVRSL